VSERGRGENNMGMPDGVKKQFANHLFFENEDPSCLLSLCWKEKYSREEKIRQGY